MPAEQPQLPVQAASVPQEVTGQPRRVVAGGWGMLLYFAMTNTLMQTSVSNEMRGRVIGIWALVFGGMMPLGGLESGLLSQVVGVPWTIAAGALVCAGGGL